MPVRDQDQLRLYLERITRGSGGLEALAEQPHVMAGPEAAMGGAGSAGSKAKGNTQLAEAARSATGKLALGRESLSPREIAAVEAIIIPDKRPAFDIVNGAFTVTHPLWQQLTEDEGIHGRLLAAIPRIGRIELPGQDRIPYGGTGFVVGHGLLMTNRHVAEIFARGLGNRQILFRAGMHAALDLRRERDQPQGPVLDARAVQMIHPWWDMALLEVVGLPAPLGTLRLSTLDPRDLIGRQIAVIGYPAYDPLRNDPAVQDMIFDRTYGVKRLQPGELDAPRQTESFGKMVAAAAHDCSTLGGNSGSALIDLETGDVIGLHFGGRYLDVNYAVPCSELARDGRVRDAGVVFAGNPPGGPAPDWLHAWDNVEGSMSDRSTIPPTAAPAAKSPASVPAGRITFEVPLRITIELGGASAQTGAELVAAAAIDSTERMVMPTHDTDYAGRRGFDPDFLPGVRVPMPEARDPSVLAPLKNGERALAYQNFSVLMHAERRLALITASNVTGEALLRRPEPGRDYSRKGLGGLGPNDSEKWFIDSRLDPRFQLPDVFFTRDDGAFDKGHIVRREDVTHGTSYEAIRRANGDTFHVTNCSPQVAQFNQSMSGEDNWGDLENLVLADAASERLSLFAGPVLDPADHIFVGRGDGGQTLRVKIPSRYWKVIVARTGSGFGAYGFILEQDLSNVPLEFAVAENFRRLQAPLSEIEALTGVDFGDAVRRADTFDSDRAIELARRGGLIRTESLASVTMEPLQPTPNSGDDTEADPEPGIQRYAPPTTTEASPRWRNALATLALRRQVDARAPHRNRASDGTIGDAAHASRDSDHNPWVIDDGVGVVTAIDITHDPAGGCDAGKLAQTLVQSRDVRIKYVIWNRQIANSSAIGASPPWTWRHYGGANPHNKHMHLSVKSVKAAYDNEAAWHVP